MLRKLRLEGGESNALLVHCDCVLVIMIMMMVTVMRMVKVTLVHHHPVLLIKMVKWHISQASKQESLLKPT